MYGQEGIQFTPSITFSRCWQPVCSQEEFQLTHLCIVKFAHITFCTWISGDWQVFSFAVTRIWRAASVFSSCIWHQFSRSICMSCIVNEVWTYSICYSVVNIKYEVVHLWWLQLRDVAQWLCAVRKSSSSHIQWQAVWKGRSCFQITETDHWCTCGDCSLEM